MHSLHPVPTRLGNEGLGAWAIFQNIYLGGTYVKFGFWVEIGTLGCSDFFQVGLENSRYKR